MISYGRQFIDKQDEKSVLDALRSNWLTQGPRVLKFENKLKNILAQGIVLQYLMEL